MSDKLKLELKLLDKSFTIACSSEQVAEFENASKYLGEKLEQISSRTRALNFDKLLTMVALNITHELLQVKREQAEQEKTTGDLTERLEKILTNLEQSLEDNLQIKED